MARGTAGSRWIAAPVALTILTLLGAPAGSQPTQQPAPTVTISRDCQAGSTPTSNDSPLPHVAEALRQSKPIKILTIGATSGKRFGKGGYSALIEQMLERATGGRDVEMINRGVSGELAADAANRMKLEVALNEPTVVLWQVGTNDALAYVPLDQVEATLRDTIRWLKSHNVDVVLVGLQYAGQMARDDNYTKVRELLRRVAGEEKAMIVRRYEATQFISEAAKTGPGLFDELDRSAGSDCLAQYVAQAIAIGAFGKSFKPLPPNTPPPGTAVRPPGQ